MLFRSPLLLGTSARSSALHITSAERLSSGGDSRVRFPRGLRASFRAPLVGEARVRLLHPPRRSEDWLCTEPRTSSPLQVPGLGAGAERPDWRWPQSWENALRERLPAPGRSAGCCLPKRLPLAPLPFCLKNVNLESSALGTLARGTWRATYRLGPARKLPGE